jgi:capsular polysaccharide biosynthesis protein
VTRLTLIDKEPRIGRFLHDLVNERQYTDFFPLDDACDLERSALLYPNPPEPGIGPFGKYMLDPAFRRYHVDSIAAYAFDDIYVVGSDGVVVLNGGVLRNTLDYISSWLPDSNVEEFRRSEYVRLRRPMPVSNFVTEGRYCIGFSGAWRNHGHWLPQCLPKLFAFSLLRRRFRDLKVVLPPFAAHSPQQRTLDLLGIGPDAVFTLPPNQVTGFASAILLPNFDIWSVPPFTSMAAERVIAGLPAPPPGTPARPDRLYVHRKVKARPVANFDAVRALVERHGFVVQSFEDTDLADQAASMQAARAVISEHGAGTTNILFCREGARVLELFNPFCVQPAFWSIASRRRLDYGYLIGSHFPTPEHAQPNWNTAYEVPLDHLEAAIRVLLNQPAQAVAAPAAPSQPAPAAQPAPLAPAPLVAASALPSGGVPLASFSGLLEPIFDVTGDLGSFGRAGGHQRLMLFAAALPPPQQPIHRQSEIPPDFVAEHQHYPPPTAVHAYAVHGAVVWGNGLLTSGSQFVAPTDCLPAYFRPHMRPEGPPIHPVHAGSLNRADVETVTLDHPVASALHPNLVYGHFLLEILPRLYGLSVLRQFGADFPLLLSSTVPAWVKSFVRMLHPEPGIVWYDATRQRVVAPSVILPSMMQTEHNFHPAFNLMVEHLVQLHRPTAPGPTHLYVSRSNYGDERIENEDEVERVMTDLGFSIVHPHQMTPEEQIRLFSGARAVAGEYGSALHNAIFSPPGTRVIALNFFNNYQSKIARVRRHRLAYVPPEDGKFRHWRLSRDLVRKFRVDPEVVRRTTSEMLDEMR